MPYHTYDSDTYLCLTGHHCRMRRCTPTDLAALVLERSSWARAHISPSASTWLNLADWPAAMACQPGLVLQLVQALAALPVAARPAGLMVEDPSGCCYPFEVGPWVAVARRAMLAGGWSGHLLVHMHHNYGLAQVGGTVHGMHDMHTLCGVGRMWAGVSGVWAGVVYGTAAELVAPSHGDWPCLACSSTPH
jgi:hypothetical protein